MAILVQIPVRLAGAHFGPAEPYFRDFRSLIPVASAALQTGPVTIASDNIYSYLCAGSLSKVFIMILDESTFKQVYNDFFEPVCRFLNHYSQDIQAIEDVVQDVFVALWEDCRSCEITYIKTYLYHSARNRMLNYLRDAGNRIRILEDWAQSEDKLRKATDCINRNRFHHLLSEAVETLPDKCRAIFILHKEVRLSYREIATKQNVSLKTVENQMTIAFRKIREYIIAHTDRL